MNKILIYGDSNVWGDNFITGKRIDDDKQWINKLQNKLGKNYKLLQEGLPGRIAGDDEIEKKYKNGKDTFISIFRSNAPVNKVIIALGTNDLQLKYNKSSDKIIEDLLWYTDIIKNLYDDLDDRKKYFIDEKMPEIIYLLPINFDYKNNASMIFDEKSEEKRKKIISYFKSNSILNLSIDKVSLFSDGIHLDYEGHEKVCDIVYKELTKNE